jgi:hypothetical protein
MLFIVHFGAVAQPVVTVSPTSHNYGSIDVGKIADKSFRIRNNGSSNLDGTASLLFGQHFSMQPGLQFSIPAGSFQDITVSFTPNRPGQQFDSLFVFHNAGNRRSPVAISLLGTGIPRPEVEVTPLAHDFDTVSIRFNARTSFFVTNPGSGQLSVRTTIDFGAPAYRIVTTTDAFVVSAGDTAEVIVEYDPKQITRNTGFMHVKHNGVNQASPVVVELHGVGGPEVSLDPTEPNNQASAAFPIAYGFASDSTEIWPNGDIDYFKFTGIFGDWITIAAENAEGSGLNGKLWLFDSLGTLIAENDDAGSNDRSEIIDTLRASGTYFVRFAFANNGGNFPNDASAKSSGTDPLGAYSLSLQWSGRTPLGTPELDSPADGATDEFLDPILAWRPLDGATMYGVQVSTSEAFNTIIFQTNLSDTSVALEGLAPGTRFFWRVRGGYEIGWADYTQPTSFETSFAPVVVSLIPDTLLPSGTLSIDLGPVFLDPEGGPLAYGVTLTDSTVVSAAIEGDQLVLEVIGSGATEVIVGATDPKGASASTSFSVIAGEATSADRPLEAPPGQFSIGPLYPNPFGLRATLPVQLAESSPVRVTLFDLQGRAVRVLMDRQMPAGRHELVVSGIDLPPGVYVIRLEANGYSGVESMVVSH